MSTVITNDYDGRMPYVRFESVVVDDNVASLEAGHYVGKNVDIALVTPPYSKDIIKHKLPAWFKQLETDVATNRIPMEWFQHLQQSYAAWRKGQELPVDGIPIKGWGVISPAMQETLIKMHVVTVEQLAAITAEGTTRIGMGGVDLKNKAVAWLSTLKKAGRPTMEISALRRQVEQLQISNEALEKKLALIYSQNDGIESLTEAALDECFTAD